MMKKIFPFSSSEFRLILLLTSVLAAGSCADEDLVDRSTQGDKGATVAFRVNNVQEEMLLQQTDAPPMSTDFDARLRAQGLTREDLEIRQLQAESSAGLDACLIETTVEGVNPEKPAPETRANIKTQIDDDFTSLGYRGTTADGMSDTWFHNARTQRNGTLYEPVKWVWEIPYARFYAVFPLVTDDYNKLKLSAPNPLERPYVEFEAEQDVKKQVDLLTACSGTVHYQTKGTAPESRLDFRHTLTAIKFAVGQNLSWNKNIDRIEIQGACSRGRYKFSDRADGQGAEWTDLTDRRTFVLDLGPTGVNTKQAPNNILTGNNGDNYTFYMIPQQLEGKGVKVDVHFTDNTRITVTLKGRWKPGTTKTYKLSNTQSNWNYVFSVIPAGPMEYDQIKSNEIKIQSYRQAPDGTQRLVGWEVAGYDANGDDIFTTAEKPDWLTSLSRTEGPGHPSYENIWANCRIDIVDTLDLKRNKPLREATPRGSAGDRYDLSMHDIHGNATPRNTANCYLISAPGFYKLPLVYGNAIKNGATNESAYTSQAPATMVDGKDVVLHRFVDYMDEEITDPWIEKSKGGIYTAETPYIVWADEKNLVRNLALAREGGEAYLQFEVTPADMRQGNAVVAVKLKGPKYPTAYTGWSWHLWFAPTSALETIACTNFQGVTYNLTAENLGWKYTRWSSSVFNAPRSVRIKFRQTVANGGQKKEAIITLTQNSGDDKAGCATLYQWGHSVGLPGGNHVEGAVGIPSIANHPQWKPFVGITIGDVIRNPNTYKLDNYWHKNFLKIAYRNLWSADNHTTGYNDNPVVKTIYDPCPVGFHIPAPNAFTGFTRTGGQAQGEQVNGKVDRRGDWTFNNKLNNPDATIYFPKISYWATLRKSIHLYIGTSNQYYRTATPPDDQIGNCCFQIYNSWVTPNKFFSETGALGIRPVAEE